MTQTQTEFTTDQILQSLTSQIATIESVLNITPTHVVHDAGASNGDGLDVRALEEQNNHLKAVIEKQEYRIKMLKRALDGHQ